MSSGIDAKDKTILEILRQDSRTPVSVIAEKVSLSRTPCALRIRKLEELGLIRQYTIVSGNEFEEPPRKFLLIGLVKVDDATMGAVARCLSQSECVVWAAISEGPFDVIAVLNDGDNVKIADLLRSLRQIPHIKSTRTFSVVEEIVRKYLPIRGAASEKTHAPNAVSTS